MAALEQGLELPPTVELLVRERFHESASPAALRKELSRRGILRDIRRQAEYATDRWEYEDSKTRPASGNFVVTPSPAMNPLSNVAKCSSSSCRVEAARAFARSVGLYGDYTIVPDVFTAQFAQVEAMSGSFANELYKDLTVLRELMPLIEAGAIRFAAPGHWFCPHCNRQLDKALTAAVRSLTDAAMNEQVDVAILRGSTGRPKRLSVEIPALSGAFGHSLSWISPLTAQEAKVLQALSSEQEGKPREEAVKVLRTRIERAIKSEVEPVLLDMHSSRTTRSVLAAGSRIETLVLREIERTRPNLAEVEAWELIRTVQLPWVKDLSVSEVVQLRHDASRALPGLRSLLAKRLLEPGHGSEEALARVAQELREEAVDVEAELAAWDASGGRHFQLGLGSLGVSFVLYGLTAGGGVAATALGALMTTLAAAHPAAQKETVETAKLKSRPAYVLVRARELLQHRE